MADRMSRVLIETLIRNALKEFKNAPEQSIRKLVDIALEFSDGRFQQAFFHSVAVENALHALDSEVKRIREDCKVTKA